MSGQLIISVAVLLPLLVGIGVVLALPWLGSAEQRAKRRTTQAGFIGPFDELWHPAAYQANIIREIQTELPAPAPIPGDNGVRDGKITIRL